MSRIPENILQAGCTAYADTFLNGNGSLGEGIEAAYFAIHEHDEWVRASPPAWNGEGLPPAGVTCEVKSIEGWHLCTVFAIKPGINSDEALYDYAEDDGSLAWSSCASAELFRPIRTPEQIAADDREAAIQQMCADAGRPDMPSRSIAQAAMLYDAGWRKQEAP